MEPTEEVSYLSLWEYISINFFARAHSYLVIIYEKNIDCINDALVGYMRGWTSLLPCRKKQDLHTLLMLSMVKFTLLAS